MRIITVILLSSILFPSLLSAHGPSRQKVQEEIIINASAEKVWALISDFCIIKRWHPAITDCTSSDNAGELIRILTLSNGQKLKEKLIKRLSEKMRLQYMMLEPNTEAFPINTHGATLSVQAVDDDHTKLQWKGAFYRSFPGPNPPPDQTDETGRQAISTFYQEGLQGIKQQLEK